jgi:hypothetical protein
VSTQSTKWKRPTGISGQALPGKEVPDIDIKKYRTLPGIDEALELLPKKSERSILN